MGNVIDTVLMQRRAVPAVEAGRALAPAGADAADSLRPAPRAAAAPHRAGPATEDVVGALTEALRQAGEVSPAAHHRPLDVQYWACWVALALAAVLPVVLVVLG